jgi:hypothetical protein
MNILSALRVWKLTGRIEIVWVLLEEEWQVAIWVIAHFDRMGSVIATDAINAAHWKFPTAGNRNTGYFGHWDYVIGHYFLPASHFGRRST